jgi:hypothetical protein
MTRYASFSPSNKTYAQDGQATAQLWQQLWQQDQQAMRQLMQQLA